MEDHGGAVQGQPRMTHATQQAGVGAHRLFGLVEQIVPQMDQAHHSTNPSHGTMFLLQPVDLETISVIERTKEIGVMRAIGAQTHIIMGMFVLEGLLLLILYFILFPILNFLPS